MTQFRVQFVTAFSPIERERDRRIIDADYFKIEDHWVTFKDSGHKVVFSVLEGHVAYIERLEQAAA